ncbi:uncharacterized protein LOC124449143 [Xenia sp. Carnegie-2017]|uniref:uncharacterized protein LOC124449143 n=1 Tax=Xenia sp. Carnegie-2017 TaxID=2897299 RepID=UPI001F04C5B1|nr:uncharacterized protein LOC124449143 [Xenia sp. Carnegie-2017]
MEIFVSNVPARRRRALSKSGAAASTLPTCKYFEVMRFLHEKTSNLETHSNVDLEIQTIPENILDISSSQSPGPSQPSSSCSSVSDEAKYGKRKRPNSNDQLDPFLDHVKSMDQKMVNYLEGLSVLRDMEKKQLRQAKLKIQQLLYDLQYSDS